MALVAFLIRCFGSCTRMRSTPASERAMPENAQLVAELVKL